MGRVNSWLEVAFNTCRCFLVVKYTQSLVTIQKDGATKVQEAFSSPFGYLHESFLDSSVVGHGNDFLR